MGKQLRSTTERVIGAAIEVHRLLGPRYQESVYELALETEFQQRGIPFRRQVTFSLQYKGRLVGEGRLDFLVEEHVVIELKAVEAMGILHTAQVLSYLKATGHHLALLINFNVPTLTAGIRRVVL